MEFYTVGVYNSTESEFFSKLTDNNIDTFCDIRQRRGVRGAQYSFVNSKRLQARLESLGIKYKHIIDLAPTPEIRELQKKSDLEGKIQKRNRSELGEVFRTEFKKRVLDSFNLSDFISELKSGGSQKIVLFCVEEKAAACHRSIVANAIRNQSSFSVKDL